jgi:hypothetical protein
MKRILFLISILLIGYFLLGRNAPKSETARSVSRGDSVLVVKPDSLQSLVKKYCKKEGYVQFNESFTGGYYNVRIDRISQPGQFVNYNDNLIDNKYPVFIYKAGKDWLDVKFQRTGSGVCVPTDIMFVLIKSKL